MLSRQTIMHFEPVIECLEAGKHVMCEKPLSLDIKEAEQMVAKGRGEGRAPRH